MRGDNYINCNNAVINRAIVLAALAKSNLHWEMHQAQVYSLDCQVLQEGFTELTGEISEDLSREIFNRPQSQITLMGLPVIIDNTNYPKDLIRLMSGDKELSRLECLAVPGVFIDQNDYTEEGMQREREKYIKLTY